MGDALDRGRTAYGRAAWREAHAQLSAAAEAEPLEVDDLERLAAAAYLTGHAEESYDVWARAHQEHARLHDAARAARCAFWIAFGLLNSGESAGGGGGRRVAHRGGRLVLHGHRGVPGAVRPPPGARVDGRPEPLVRVAARAGPVPRSVPRAPGRDHALPWRVGRLSGGGAARLRP